MRASVGRRDASDRGIGKERNAVAAHDVAAIEALAEEERVIVGKILLGGVQLVEPAIVAGEEDRHPSHVHSFA